MCYHEWEFFSDSEQRCIWCGQIEYNENITRHKKNSTENKKQKNESQNTNNSKKSANKKKTQPSVLDSRGIRIITTNSKVRKGKEGKRRTHPQ